MKTIHTDIVSSPASGLKIEYAPHRLNMSGEVQGADQGIADVAHTETIGAIEYIAIEETQVIELPVQFKEELLAEGENT